MAIEQSSLNEFMSDWLFWRNPQGLIENENQDLSLEVKDKWNDNLAKTIVTEFICGYAAVIATIETIFYTAVASASLIIYPFTNRLYGVKNLQCSSFTIVWAIANIAYYNLFFTNIPTQESFARVQYFSGLFKRNEDENLIRECNTLKQQRDNCINIIKLEIAQMLERAKNVTNYFIKHANEHNKNEYETVLNENLEFLNNFINENEMQQNAKLQQREERQKIKNAFIDIIDNIINLNVNFFEKEISDENKELINDATPLVQDNSHLQFPQSPFNSIKISFIQKLQNKVRQLEFSLSEYQKQNEAFIIYQNAIDSQEINCALKKIN